MDLQVYHNIILDLLRKERLNIPTHEVIDSFTHLAQIELYESEFKKYGETQVEQDSLAPFKKHIQFISNDNGTVNYPNDYGHLISAYTTTYDNDRQLPVRHKVQFVQEDKISDAINNQVRKISIEYPIATSNLNQIILFPQVLHTGGINYFSIPVTPKFVYTISGRQVVYDQANSVQLAWNEQCTKQIMMKTLEYLGLNINENQLIQFGQLKEANAN